MKKSNEVILAEAVSENAIVKDSSENPDCWCRYCDASTEELDASPGFLPDNLHGLDCPYLVAIKVLKENKIKLSMPVIHELYKHIPDVKLS